MPPRRPPRLPRALAQEGGALRPRDVARLRLAAAERSRLELLGEQLPHGGGAGVVRHPLLEQRPHQPPRHPPCRVPRARPQELVVRPRVARGARDADRSGESPRGRLRHWRPRRPHHAMAGVLSDASSLRGSSHVRRELERTHSGARQSTGERKSGFFTSESDETDETVWHSGAQRHQGTWWDHWSEWLAARSGERRSAPTRLGSDAHPALMPAPGRYVHQRA